MKLPVVMVGVLGPEWICDGHTDCIHGTDEDNCSMSLMCQSLSDFIILNHVYFSLKFTLSVLWFYGI